MKINNFCVALMVVTSAFTACKKNDLKAPAPTADKIEIGTANNKRGIIGADFHFNAEVIAGDKIENVQVKIMQRSTETYTAPWKLEIDWEQYNGAKNATVHKHFTIPTDAPKGKYDFYFIVTDQNGTKLEIKEDFTILTTADLPVNPTIELRIAPSENQVFKKGDLITARVRINDTKDEGRLLVLLIKDKAKHYPEAVMAVDFSKAIVMINASADAVYSTITVGAVSDNNSPNPSPITGDKAWESGKYNLVILYQNITHNVGVFKSIPIVIDNQ